MNESTQLDKLNGLIGHIKGQIDILEDIAIAEEGGDEHVFADDNRIKRSVYGAISTLAAEAGSIVDWLQNREEEKGDVDAAIEEEPEPMEAEWSAAHGWVMGAGVNIEVDENGNVTLSDTEKKNFRVAIHADQIKNKHQEACAEALGKGLGYSFTASSCHDYGTEPLSDTVTKEKPCGHTIVGPDNKVRFKGISKTFVRMIRDSPYAQTEQLWVMKEGLFVPGVIGIMKIEDFK